jgi:hypothetical protein
VHGAIETQSSASSSSSSTIDPGPGPVSWPKPFRFGLPFGLTRRRSLVRIRRAGGAPSVMLAHRDGFVLLLGRPVSGVAVIAV